MSRAKELEPERIDLTASELEALFSRLEKSNLDFSDKKLIKNVFRFSVWLQQRLARGKLKINKLRKLLFGDGTEKRGYRDKDKGKSEKSNSSSEAEQRPEQGGSDSASADEASNTFKPIVLPGGDSADKKKGHGRMAASAYETARDIEVKHTRFQIGDSCPGCLAGHFYEDKPGVIIRILGSNIAQIYRYTIQRLRCNTCGLIVMAELPDDVGPEKYDAKFKAILAVQHYYGGMPFYRQEMLQGLLKFPLPDSTQWDLVESVANSIYPVFNALAKVAAQGELVHNDDTGVKILELIWENKANPDKERKGMFTTGLMFQSGGHEIALFYSSEKHAGENLGDVLQKRSKTLKEIIQMCDALSRNAPKEISTILCNCLAHGRRQFIDVESFFPDECLHVIGELGKVYKNDAQAKVQELSPAERLRHHQEYSGPVMRELRQWMDHQIEGRLTEPNSGLGDAIRYMQKHWPELTQFLSVAGAPIDNNIVERALKIAIRLRKNSLFYRTVHSAFVGSLLTSIIHTCRLADENPVDYLTALQENKSRVFKAPSQWLPWNYRDTLAALSEDLAQGHDVGMRRQSSGIAACVGSP